jgi:hypothetical protein
MAVLGRIDLDIIISPACGPPLWEQCDVQISDEMPGGPDWDLAAQSAPDYEVDQGVNW